MRRKLFSLLASLLLAFLFTLLASCKSGESQFVKARNKMVETQLKWRQIGDIRLLAAMAKVPRHLFVPPSLQNLAYSDRPLPIGEGQTISQPYVIAFMTQALELKPTDKVLEIGTGSGYHAAILAELANEVYTIEIVSELAVSAEKRLNQLEYRNIFVKAGDGYLGWPEKAPFDTIVLTASPPKVPQPLIDQLKEGGRLVVPLGGDQKFQELVLYTKENGKFKELRHLAPVMFVPMTGKIQEEHEN